MFTLPKLPYDYDALEPHIDAETMKLHHTKHHQTYVDKLNAALEGEKKWLEMPVEDVLRQFDQLPESVKTAVRNHGGGHANHSLFWTTLAPAKEAAQAPSGELATALDELAGSFDKFKEDFTAAATALFGSGWTWLVVNESKELELLSLPNQDSPLMQGKTPIFGLDVWEHAYYLKYQNKRPEYIAAIWNVVNWDEVARRYEVA
jgi:Fe-Mn family superoxide dismutase